MTQSDFLPASRPMLADLKSYDDWLSRALLSEPRQACHEFTMLIEGLEDAPPRHDLYLDILERLRKPAASAQQELSKKFAAKALPLSHSENAAFEQSYDLWRALMRGYRRLFRASLKDTHPELAGRQPMLCQRALEATGELLATFWTARREADPDLWQIMHDLYAAAEARSFADLPVAGASPSQAKSCTSTYLRPVLLQLARPCSLPAREFVWMRRWAYRWAHKLRVNRSTDAGGALCIDLSENDGASWTTDTAPAESRRYLDTTDLARSLRGRLKLLGGGASPAELGFGADCTQPSCSELLSQLVRCWTDAPSARQFPRRQQAGSTELVTGIAAIHFAVSGRPFDGGIKQWDYTRREADQMHVFQHAPGANEKRAALQAVPLLEQWETLDESATGFRLCRRGPGARLQLRQLLALRPQGAKQLILAEVRWAYSSLDNALYVGAQALPGLARACAVRVATDDPAQKEAWSQAFLLPVAPGLAPSLVLPAGWYQNGREIDLQVDDETFRVSLFGLLGRGHDYDRANFTARR